MEYNNKVINNFESKYPDSKLYPEVDKSQGKNNTKHLIIFCRLSVILAALILAGYWGSQLLKWPKRFLMLFDDSISGHHCINKSRYVAWCAQIGESCFLIIQYPAGRLSGYHCINKYGYSGNSHTGWPFWPVWGHLSYWPFWPVWELLSYQHRYESLILLPAAGIRVAIMGIGNFWPVW